MVEKSENVLVFQGGGSLGAYECGVYKTFAKNNIHLDIIAGTSIGAVNAAIIAGSKDQKTASQNLSRFWSEISERTTSFLSDDFRPIWSSSKAAIYGNSKVFLPEFLPWEFAGITKPHLYELSPLKETLSKYIDFDLLKKGTGNPRLIVTAVDLLKGCPVTFDSHKQTLDADHIISSAGYPFYGIKWTKKNSKYLWDGSIMSNTPFREVINASPHYDKQVFIVSLFPKKHPKLPKNLSETWHRARDLMHTDKTEQNLKMSKVVSRYLDLLKNMHEIIEKSELTSEQKKLYDGLKPEYDKLVERRGAVIKKMIKIERQEESHYVLEDADFSYRTIKRLISQGEGDAEKILKEKKII